MAADNHLVANFKLEGITPAPAGKESMDVTFSIDANGLLNVTAKDVRKGHSKSIVIT